MSNRIQELYSLGSRETSGSVQTASRALGNGGFSNLLDAQMELLDADTSAGSAGMAASAFAALAMGGGSGMIGAMLSQLAGKLGDANASNAPAAAAKAYNRQSLNPAPAQAPVQEGPRTVSGGGYADMMVEPEYYDPECRPRVFLTGG